MKTLKEIFARTVLLQCLSDRCCLDMDWGDETRPVEDREKDREAIWNWINDKGYLAYATEVEKELFELPVAGRKFKKNELIEIDVQAKAMDVLLWVLGLIEEPIALYVGQVGDNHKILGISKAHDLETEVARCKLRGINEIELQRDIEFLWDWRINHVDIKATKGAGHHITTIISEQFGDRYDEALKHINLYIPKNPRSSADFVECNLVVRELYKWQIDLMKHSTQWRHHALEWVLDNE